MNPFEDVLSACHSTPEQPILHTIQQRCLHSAASALACHNFISLLDFDKALRCLGALQIWVVPAEGAHDHRAVLRRSSFDSISIIMTGAGSMIVLQCPNASLSSAGGFTVGTEKYSLPMLKGVKECKVKCKWLTVIQASCMPS